MKSVVSGVLRTMWASGMAWLAWEEEDWGRERDAPIMKVAPRERAVGIARWPDVVVAPRIRRVKLAGGVVRRVRGMYEDIAGFRRAAAFSGVSPCGKGITLLLSMLTCCLKEPSVMERRVWK